MADNNDLRVIVGLDIGKSAIEIEKDLPELEKLLASKDSGKLKIVGQLDTTSTEKNINQQLSKLKIDNTALKIVPQLDISGNNNIGQQITKQVENSTKNIDFSAIAKNLRKAFNINDNVSIKEATENIKAMYEAFNVDPAKYKDAFNKLISWYEQRSNDLVYSERQKVDELNNLMLELYNQPELHYGDKMPGLGKHSKNDPLLVTKGTLEEMKSLLGSMQEVYKLFGSVKVDDRRGALIGSFGEDWDPKEYNDALSVYIQYLQKIQKLRKASRFQPTDVMPQSEYESIIKLTEQSILEQLNLVNANNKVVQSNEKVAQSERDVAKAQQEINNTRPVSANGSNDLLKQKGELANQVAASELKILGLEQQLQIEGQKLASLRKEYDNAYPFDEEGERLYKQVQEAQNRYNATKQMLDQENATHTALNEQMNNILSQIEQEKQRFNQATQNMNGGSNGNTGIGASANYFSSNSDNILAVANSAKEAEEYYKRLLTLMGDTKGVVTSTEYLKGAEGELKAFTVAIKSGTGAFETFRYTINEDGAFDISNITAANAGVQRLVEAQAKLEVKIEGVRAKYTRLLEEFKSSNSAIQTGLTQPIVKFEEVLNGLGTTHSIEDVKNQFESLKTSAAEISKYLDTTNNSFNKTRNAINNYNQMDDAIKRIETSYGNLVIKNEELGKSVINLRSSYSALVEKEKEQGGYTAEWAKDYQAVNAALREVRVNVEAAVRAESNSQNADRNSQYQIQQRYLDRIRQNYIELNKLQNALVSSGKNETAEIQRQIKQVRSRISYATEQLKKRELFANVEAQINEYENEFDRKQSLRNGKTTDRLIANYTKMADEISRSVQELTKLQTSSTFSENSNNNSVKNLKIQIDGVITDLNNLYELLSNSTVDKKTFISLQERLNTISEKAKEVKLSFNDIKAAVDSAGSARSLEKQTASLMNSIKELQNVTSLTDNQRNTLSGLLNRTELAQDKAALEQISVELTRLRGEIKQTGTESKNFDQISKSVEKVITDLDAMGRSQIFNTHSNNAGVIEFQDKIKGLSDTAKQVKADLNVLGDNKAIPPELRTRVEELKQKFDELNGSNKTLQANLRQSDGWARTERQIQTLTARIKEYMAVNTKAASKYKSQFDGLFSGLSQAEMNKDSEAVRRLSADFQILQHEIKAAGDQGKTLFERIKADVSKFTGWLSITTVVSTGVREIRKMVQEVVKLDNSLLELSKVSDLTANGIKKVTERAFELSKQVGKTGTDVIDATTNFKRAGFELEESINLAEKALVLTNVAEGINDAGEAATALISIMKGYGDTSTDFAQKILDAVNEVSNTQAIDFDSLIDGSQRLAAVAKQGSMSFEQMLGILTGTNEVLQNIEKTSSGAITIFTRLQSVQLPDEEDVLPLAKLQETFNKNTNGMVNIIDQTTGELRNVYDILNDISEVWDTLDKNTQEGLAFAAAGTRQKNVFLSMMENWENVKKSVDSANNSIGSATEENQKYLDSISGRLSVVESNFQSLSNTVINSDLVKFLVSGAGGALGLLDNIISKFGTLQTLLPIIMGSLSAFRNVGRAKMSALKREYADCNVVVTRNELMIA